jgi:hypothetical protein
MTSAPKLAYHGRRPETPDKNPDELPDITLPERRRRELKKFVDTEALPLDSHEAMFVAGGFEDVARRKRSQEERS